MRKLVVFSRHSRDHAFFVFDERGLNPAFVRSFEGWTWGRDVKDLFYFVDDGQPFQITEFGGDLSKIVEELQRRLKDAKS